MHRAVDFVVNCLLETDGMTQREKTKYMMVKVQGTIKCFHQTSRYTDHDWCVGDVRGAIIRHVCR